ncbi:MAG: response regulator [Dehalococcoidia bacterium]|jgi:DNA-binding response OmpR family regulator|nr:response regulator [Dehalococcoidia bacterium]
MPRILIIDDEPDLRLALGATLEDHGYEVFEGSDGSEALELAIKHSPDVMILDINMPVVDGITALKILKGDERTREIPVCILTAVKDVAHEYYVAELGAADFFLKPWSEDRMVRRLAELIEERSSGAGGSVTADTFAEYETASNLTEWLRMERNERLLQTIQARHNTWVSLS